MIALQVLGPLELHCAGQLLAWPSRKAAALLLRLALAGPQRRAALAALLWPDQDESSGRRNLRRELARLREAGAGDAVRADGDRLELAPDVRLDTVEFAAWRENRAPEAALALWRGAVAEDLDLPEATEFAEWLARERERLQARRREAMDAAAAEAEAAGRTGEALAWLDRLLADDPLQERHHRAAMRLLAADGRHDQALARYRRLRELLRSELGLSPMAETEALAAALAGAPAPEPAAVAAVPPASASDAPAQLPEPLPFAGRRSLVEQLEAAWQAGRTVLLEGEAGIGKSRLARDFAAAHGPLAVARCRPGDAELPYAAVARALRAMGAGSAPLDELPPWVRPELARLLPELGPSPPPLSSAEERRRFYEACDQAWRLLADDNFDAVLFDDWHLADEASSALIVFIAQRRHEAGRGGAREWLLMRPQSGAAALAERLQALHGTLPALDGDEVLELVCRLSGAGRPERFAAHLSALTAGNPFYISETLRHWVDQGWLRADADGRWLTPFDDTTADYRELGVPASVLEAVRTRVGRLSGAAQRVLEAAALAGEPFRPGLLAPACALSELESVMAIEEALAVHLLREHEEGGFAFGHDLVQQALAAALSPERRRLVHRRLALGAEAAGAPAAVIAVHHEASGEPARAVAFRIRAGDEAQALQAPVEAQGHWQKALDDGASPAQALKLHQQLARVARLRDDRERQRQHVAALIELAASSTLDPEAATEGRIAAATEMAVSERSEEALALLDRLPQPLSPALAARSLGARADALHTLGRLDEARAAVDAALALPALQARERMLLSSNMLMIEQGAGRIREALRHIDTLSELAAELGDRFASARAHYFRGVMLHDLGDQVRAEAELLLAEGHFGRQGFVHIQRAVLYNLAAVHSAGGRPQGVLDVARRGWALQPPCPPGNLRVMYRLAFVDAHLALGELGAAWEHAQPVLPESLALSDPAVRISVAMSTLELLALVGELGAARALLDDIDALSADQSPHAALECAVVRAEVALQAGDAATARRLLSAVQALTTTDNARTLRRLAIAEAALALAEGEVAGALSRLPDDTAPGMNDELRLRALTVHLGAAAAGGAVPAALAEACGRALAAPDAHVGAAVRLHRALAAAARAGVPGVPTGAEAAWARLRQALAASLADHPVQRVAFLRDFG